MVRATPIDSWDGLKQRFRAYRLRPSPTGMGPNAFLPSGRLRKKWLVRFNAQARRASDRVSGTIDQLRKWKLLPDLPSTVKQSTVNAIARAVRKKAIQTKPYVRAFWEALILDRAGFACQHCGRTAGATFKEFGGRRSIRLAVDHLRPIDPRKRKRIMRELRDLRFDNCVSACTTCNTLKSHWPVKVFEQELHSLRGSSKG